MNCRYVESILASGAIELSADALSHLESCPACAEVHRGEEDFQRLLDLAATTQVEPPEWLWHRIGARIQSTRPESAWDEFVRGVERLFEVPDLRPAWVALVLALVLSASLTGLRSRLDDGALLAELQNYELEVPENPFLPEPVRSNPFLSELRGDSNRFQGGGGQLR